MKHFISDHTPMDDYQWTIKQSYYTIESDEEYIWTPDNHEEKLKSSKIYRYIVRTVKILLILTGIMVLGTVMIVLLLNQAGKSVILRNLALTSLLAAVGFFGLAISFAVAGAWIESYCTGKDNGIREERRRRTLLLQNGNIAVIYKSFERVSQIPTRFFDFNRRKEVDTPFSRMYLISRVYSLSRKNGKIIASVKCLEHMMIRPYVSEYAYDNVERYVRYYTRNVHKKFEWSDEMINAEKLVSALQALEKREK